MQNVTNEDIVISIHAPLAESDVDQDNFAPEEYRFQSTLPSRRATYVSVEHLFLSLLFQSTLPSRRATADAWTPMFPKLISIHAPLAESDL